MIRDLRRAREMSQTDLASALEALSGVAVTRERISRWERANGGVIPSDYWIRHLSAALDVPYAALATEATLSRVHRREFMRLTALTATHGALASELLSSIAGSDAGPLATVQTTHATDLVIAAFADPASRIRLGRWMRDNANPVVRVNAAGILAKLPGQESAADVCRILSSDPEVRQLYTTAVTARVCGMDWKSASQLAADPLGMPVKAAFIAARFADEVTNPRDAGARWCSASMLRDMSPLIGKEPRSCT